MITKTRTAAIQMQALTVNSKTTFSSNNVVQNSMITDTGTVLEHGFFGKAILVGWQPIDWGYNGYGNGNTFQKNTVDLHSTGYGVNISAATTGNVVCSDNVATNALHGLTNIKTTQCKVITMPTCADVLNLPLSAN